MSLVRFLLYSNQFEVEALIDGDHQPQVLECKRDDLGSGNLELLRELADRHELINTDRLTFLLDRSATLRLDLFTRHGVITTGRTFPSCTTA